VRGKGLMFAVEMADPATGAPSSALAGRVLEATRERGLLVGKGGVHGNVLRMAPPLTLSAQEAAEGRDILLDAVRAVDAQA
jgi:4-aminobutyrate aminotransferase-like enzyme